MIGLLQRVQHASVRVAEETVGQIDHGLLVLVGIERGDTPRQAERLLEKLLDYRVFEDEQGRMNRSLRDRAGGLLLVPQFTLAADTRKGLRPSFTPAAEPAAARMLFDGLVACALERHQPVAQGRFGANMQVELINDGPVTFWLQQSPHEENE